MICIDGLWNENSIRKMDAHALGTNTEMLCLANVVTLTTKTREEDGFNNRLGLAHAITFNQRTEDGIQWYILARR
jgi:hypothetical protein